MQLITKNMTEEYAIEILSWNYAKPYDFYNNDLSTGAVQEMLDHAYFIVVDMDDTLIGFFCIGKSAQVPAGNPFGAYQEDKIDIGFGMKPEFTGKGNGFKFLTHILRFIDERFPQTDIRLTVATFNKRAIHLYIKFGFIKAMDFYTDAIHFITMVKHYRSTKGIHNEYR